MRKWEICSKHVFSAVFRHFFALFIEFSTISIFFVEDANWNFKWLLESILKFRKISTGFEAGEKLRNFLKIVSHFFGIFLCSIFAKNYEFKKFWEFPQIFSEHWCSKGFKNICLYSILEFLNIFFFQKIQIRVYIAWKYLRFS